MLIENYFFTIFTPTFNRAHLLPSVYSSLLAQKTNDFEWIVVDDGSTDETEAIVGSWIQKSNFPIRYFRQPNSGKHVAINRAVAEAQGTLFVIIDSDDELAPGALKSIRETWSSIPEELRGGYAGVAGLCAYKDGRIVGTCFPKETLDTNNVELRARYRVKGDKLEVYRLDILRKFSFPENLGAFVTEGLIWNRIALKYQIRCVNVFWAIVEYHSDGLSAKSILLRTKNPIATYIYYNELLNWTGQGMTASYLVRTAMNFIRFSMHKKEYLPFLSGNQKHRLVCMLTWFVGALLYLRDRLVLWLRKKINENQ